MMITVELNVADFEYDIHSLVKAFYPEHDVLVRAVCTEAPESLRTRYPEAVFHLAVVYKEAEIWFSFFSRTGVGGSSLRRCFRGFCRPEGDEKPLKAEAL